MILFGWMLVVVVVLLMFFISMLFLIFSFFFLCIIQVVYYQVQGVGGVVGFGFFFFGLFGFVGFQLDYGYVDIMGIVFVLDIDGGFGFWFGGIDYVWQVVGVFDGCVVVFEDDVFCFQVCFVSWVIGFYVLYQCVLCVGQVQ